MCNFYLGRFRLLLSDGKFSTSFSLLGARLSSIVHNQQLSPFSIIKIKDYFNIRSNDSVTVVIMVMEVEIVASGCDVGIQLGNPVELNSAGLVSVTTESSRDKKLTAESDNAAVEAALEKFELMGL